MGLQGCVFACPTLPTLRQGPGCTLPSVALQIASTWEGIRACEELQKQGIDTNMTLLFSFGQVSIPILPQCTGNTSVKPSGSACNCPCSIGQ